MLIGRLPIGSILQFTIYDCGLRSLDGVYPAFVAEVEIEVADPALDGTPKPAKNKSASICVNLRLKNPLCLINFNQKCRPERSGGPEQGRGIYKNQSKVQHPGT